MGAAPPPWIRHPCVSLLGGFPVTSADPCCEDQTKTTLACRALEGRHAGRFTCVYVQVFGWRVAGCLAAADRDALGAWRGVATKTRADHRSRSGDS